MSRALSFFSPTPRRLRRPDHPNLFLLGFSSKLILWLSSFFQIRSCSKTRTRQGYGREGRAGGQEVREQGSDLGRLAPSRRPRTVGGRASLEFGAYGLGLRVEDLGFGV